jgi:hypothetical protein
MISKILAALAVLAAGAAVPYTLDSGATWKLVVLWGATAVCALLAFATLPSVLDRVWTTVARRVAPKLEAQKLTLDSRAAARHLLTELGTIDRTVENAVANGYMWNVRFEGLPADQWAVSADTLARGAPEVHDAVAPVYVDADQLNKLANNYTQGGMDELLERDLDCMRRFRVDVMAAVKALRAHADSS